MSSIITKSGLNGGFYKTFILFYRKNSRVISRFEVSLYLIQSSKCLF
jgi:hypothetical protein